MFDNFKTILFVSTSNLTSKPRLLKEAILAKNLGLKVLIIFFSTGGWEDANDRELVKKHDFNSIVISGTRQPFWSWLLSTVFQRMSIFLFKFFSFNMKIISFAENKRSVLLKQALEKLKVRPHIICARELGTLYPAYSYSIKNNVPFIFDMEDYHPGEKYDFTKSGINTGKSYLIKKLFPRISHITFASPAIEEYVLQHDAPELKNYTTVNNCFSEEEFECLPTDNAHKLKLVWFSLYIGPHRGLEELFEAALPFTAQVEIHLIGRADETFKDKWSAAMGPSLIFHAPVEQLRLNISLAQYDVGIATEMNAADLNRRLCLTNKIWAYHQAGLFILATDTPAQKMFMKDRCDHGVLCGQSVSELQAALQDLVSRKEELRAGKEKRFHDAKKDSWENEAEKVKAIWTKLLN